MTPAPRPRSASAGALAAVLAVALTAMGAPPALASTTPAGADPGTDRWWGANRYGTAAAIADSAFPDPPVDVVVVNGTSCADALSAAPLAASLDAAVLTVTADAIPTSTAEELQQIGPGTIWVVGGTAAVSDDVLRQLRGQAAWSVHRLSGQDRYATAARVAEKEFAGRTDQVFVASGQGCTDALAAGAAGAARGAPLLLTRGGSLPAATRDALDALDPKHITVVGGTSAVSASVEGELARQWPGAVTRIAGPDRYATAADVAETVDGTGDEVVLASGDDVPDALAGAALGLPLLLSRPDCLPQATADAYTALKTTWVDGLGGTSALSDAALAGTPCPAGG